MRKKLLSMLVLLVAVVTGAVAEGSIVCSPGDLGKVLCTDGTIVDNVAAATEASKTAAAIIAYVDVTDSKGLAIALTDESGTMDWSTAKSTCEGKTAVTNAKWCMPSGAQWQQMTKANGGEEENCSGLNTIITTHGGTGLQPVIYWTKETPDIDPIRLVEPPFPRCT